MRNRKAKRQIMAKVVDRGSGKKVKKRRIRGKKDVKGGAKRKTK